MCVVAHADGFHRSESHWSVGWALAAIESRTTSLTHLMSGTGQPHALAVRSCLATQVGHAEKTVAILPKHSTASVMANLASHSHYPAAAQWHCVSIRLPCILTPNYPCQVQGPGVQRPRGATRLLQEPTWRLLDSHGSDSSSSNPQECSPRVHIESRL